MKVSIAMGKVFQTYATSKGASRDNFRFLLEGDPVADDATPLSLEMEEQNEHRLKL